MFNVNSFIAGFIAGEGCFYFTMKSERYCYFVFVVEVHERDLKVLHLIKETLGGGYVRQYPSRPHIARYNMVIGIKNYKGIIQFFDTYLPISYKKTQYEVWKSKLISEMGNRENRAEKQLQIRLKKWKNINELHNDGLTYAEIGRRCGFTRQHIQNVATCSP